MKETKREKLLTVKELAEMLGVHPQSVYYLVSKKKIPFIKKEGIGIRFRIEDIENWMNQDIHLPAS